MSETNSGNVIEIDSIRIFYEKVGQGPNVLLLLPGGIGTSRTDFRLQLSQDEGLDRRLFTMIAWDPPGYGRSRPPDRHYHKDIYRTDADLAAKLMSKLGYKTYSVLGWSDGAKTGLLMAIKYQSSVEKLAIWGGNAYVLPQEKVAVKTFRDISLFNPSNRQYYDQEYGEELKSFVDKLVDHYVSLNDICKSEVHKIRCPTLILHGDLDPLPLEHPLFLEKQICDSRLHRFGRGGHDIHIEFSQQFKTIVTDFLKESPSEGF